MAGIAGLTGLAIYEDRRNADFQLAVHEADRAGERAVELARRPEMIPVAGAVTLLRDDPLSQGPKIFAANCSSCHRYNGTDGTGRKVTVAAKESASRRFVRRIASRSSCHGCRPGQFRLARVDPVGPGRFQESFRAASQRRRQESAPRTCSITAKWPTGRRPTRPC